MTSIAPPQNGQVDVETASELEVWVDLSTLDEQQRVSYHERPGCYGAEDPVPWRVAVDAGARPCGVCCDAFELDGVDP